MSHTQCYSEALSSAGNVDAWSSKCSKSEQRLDLWFAISSQTAKLSKFWGISFTSEYGGWCFRPCWEWIARFYFGRRNAKLWPQTGVSHENPNTKSVVKVFNRHKQMTNLEHLILPPMPKVLTIVILWDFVSSREKNVYYVQQAVLYSAYILLSIASWWCDEGRDNNKSFDTKPIVL